MFCSAAFLALFFFLAFCSITIRFLTSGPETLTMPRTKRLNFSNGDGVLFFDTGCLTMPPSKSKFKQFSLRFSPVMPSIDAEKDSSEHEHDYHGNERSDRYRHRFTDLGTQ